MGGAPEFLRFIKEELVPRMQADFKADTSRAGRVILGHSFGGLFGAYAFAADNTLFGNYLLLSPSLWFDNEVTLRMELAQREAVKSRNQLVFMGLGKMENMGKMQAPFEAYFQALHNNYTQLRLAKNLEEDLGHMGSKNPNIRKGLDFYFQNR
jgi:predicted alpha/beta superfamily hydrolase